MSKSIYIEACSRTLDDNFEIDKFKLPKDQNYYKKTRVIKSKDCRQLTKSTSGHESIPAYKAGRHQNRRRWKKIKYTYRNRKVYNAQKAQVLRDLEKRDFTRRQHEEAKSRYMKSKITFVQRSVLVKKLVKSRL
jgi:hypothetical protein